MKHHCRCGIKEHFAKFRFKQLGALGVVLMVGHILFHIAECLILPALLVAWSGHAIEDTTEEQEIQANLEVADMAELGTSNTAFLDYLGQHSELLKRPFLTLRHSSST